MSIASSCYRYIHTKSQVIHLFIECFDIILRFHNAVPDHKIVITHRLNFQIVVKCSNFLKYIVIKARNNCSINFPGFTSTSYVNIESLCLKYAFGYSRFFIEEIYMRIRYKFIKILKSHFILCKNNYVILLHFLIHGHICCRNTKLIEFFYIMFCCCF